MKSNSGDHPFFRILPIVLLIAAGAMLVPGALSAFRANGSLGFPLDDPWIHLQFAKNLHDYGAFSYFKNEMVTSGSTSPLYTFLLAVGFFFTSNEMILSYVFGSVFLLLAGWYGYRLSLVEFDGSKLFGIAALALVLFEPRLQWAALSGMETTLFVFLLLFTAHAYRTNSTWKLGVGSGLLLWARPEALIFLAVLFADMVYNARMVKPGSSRKKEAVPSEGLFKRIIPSAALLAVFAILYVGFNLWLSGSVFPNTYSAKIKYYSGGQTDFPTQVFHFLFDGHFKLMWVLMVFGSVAVLAGILRRRPNVPIMYFAWPLLLFLAYWKNLPYLYQEGRYMMPVLPFVILLGLKGLDWGLRLVRERIWKSVSVRGASWAAGFIVLVIGVQSAWAAHAKWEDYIEQCKYITERQVRTARWVAANLPANAIIGTHDIGAVAYYSGRKVVDMVGLVSPEMIENIGSLEKLMRFLGSHNVTHLVLLRNWFEIVNQTPLFQTNEARPEIMEVFAFDPARTHMTPQASGRLNAMASYYLSTGNLQQAGPMLEQSLTMDPRSSRTRFLLGKAYHMAGRLDQAETELRAAIALYPDYLDAQVALAEVSASRGKPQEAIDKLESIVRENPTFASGYAALSRVYGVFRIDSAKAEMYRQRYVQLTNISDSN